MRFLHTSDWHLGRSLYEVDLTEDQSYVLDQLIDMVADTKPDAVVIAGDVYDRALPHAQAVALLDDALVRLVKGARVPVIVIAGNHDSGTRIGFGGQLLADSGLHIAGTLRGSTGPVVLTGAHGPVAFHPLPYAEPSQSREFLSTLERLDAAAGPLDHEAAMRAHLAHMRERRPAEARNVVIAHAFVVGGRVSESERPLSIGGAGTVSAEAFDGFDYVALGHLHAPQRIGNDARVQYSGSLMKYSASEIGHTKSVTLVELDGDGRVHTQYLPLTPRRDLRKIRGTLLDLLRGEDPGGAPHDFILAELTDQGAVLDPRARLQERYPHVVSVTRPEWVGTGTDRIERRGDHRRRDHLDLFGEFFEQVAGAALTPEQRDVYATVTAAMENAEREVDS